jgi:putative endonuclease
VVPVRVKDAVGRFGEDVAVRFLEDAGFRVLERNWRSPIRELPGELDIVARDGDVIVVCEVKTRSGRGFGSPAEAVTWKKQAQVRKLARAWLSANDVGFAADIRFDVLGVLRGTDGVSVEHLRAAF